MAQQSGGGECRELPPPMPEIFKFQQFYMYFQDTFLKFSVKSENTWKFLLGKIAIKGLF